MTVGNTKAWVDTKTNGQKELSLAGHTHSYAASSHTHTKADISDFPTTITPTTHNHAANEITSGTFSRDRIPTITVDKGGTGTSIDLVNAPNQAIIRRLKTDQYDQLYYTATANGAFYATATNGQAKFGTLPVAQGGTGVTSLAALKTALGIPSSITSQEILTGTLTVYSYYGHSCSYTMPNPSTTWKSFSVELVTANGFKLVSATSTTATFTFTDASTSTFNINLSGSSITCTYTAGNSSPASDTSNTYIATIRFTGNI